MPASRQYVPPTLPRRVPRRPGLLRIGVLVASLVLSSASVAVAASTPEANCTRGKVSSLRKALKALAVCQFADLQRPDEGRRVSCEAEARARAAARLVRLDRRIEDPAYRCRGDLADLGFSRAGGGWDVIFGRSLAVADPVCAGARLKLVGRFVARAAACLARDGRSAAGCREKAADAFETTWRRLGRYEGCRSDDFDSLRAATVDLVERAGASFLVRCGDGVVAGREACDDGNREDGDGCSSSCLEESCRSLDDRVACLVCGPGAEPDETMTACRCRDGYRAEDGNCVDIDECAEGAVCPEARPCVNLEGGWACAIPCTQEAFEAALDDCGAPSGAIAFDCLDTTIAIDATAPWGSRRNYCDDLLIDGAGRGIVFALDPPCQQQPVAAELCRVPLDEHGACPCPDIDDGMGLLSLRGSGSTVRGIALQGFFEGIHLRGRDNTVEDVVFERSCDDAFGADDGAGHVFRRLLVRDGCDKCAQSAGRVADTEGDPRLRGHFNARILDTRFEGCAQPLRLAEGGRWLLERLEMVGDEDDVFECTGPRFSTPVEWPMAVYLRDSLLEGCRRGLRIGGAAEAHLFGNRIRASSLRGVRAGGEARVVLAANRIEGNGGAGSSESGRGGVTAVDGAEVDLGGGGALVEGRAAASGGNRLCGDRSADGHSLEVEAIGSRPVHALGNTWCSEDPRSVVEGDVRLSSEP